jgi:hypothetical protein
MIVLFSVIAAWITYRFVEIPIRFGKPGSSIVNMLVARWSRNNKRQAHQAKQPLANPLRRFEAFVNKHNKAADHESSVTTGDTDRIGSWRSLVAALILVILGSGATGFYVWIQKGLPERFPAVIRHITQDADFAFNRYVRHEKCFLEKKHLYDMSPECYETSRPTIAIWGDSHAAALYPGLLELQKKRSFGIVQTTLSGCGPIFKLERLASLPLCNEMNQRVFSSLIKHRPDVLLLHAGWALTDYPLANNELEQKFDFTVSEIKSKLPAARVVILGPVPRWQVSPAKRIYQSWLESSDRSQEPAIMQPAILLPEVEKALESVASRNGVEYVSLSNLLCDGALCVSRVGSAPTDMIAKDFGHLSKAGSEFLASKLESVILK